MARLDEKYWNDKWPKAPIIYAGRALRGKSDRIGIDVKKFILDNDEIMKQVIKKYRLDRGSPDQIAEQVQRFVVRSFTYKYDDETANIPEFWQFPFESLQSGIGDCEDGAILISSLLINSGIPSFRVKVAAGYVQASPTAPQGGHAYCIYLADDNKWRILDWCYYEDSSIPINKKPLASEGGQRKAYKDIWFTFNDQYSWNQSKIEIKDGRISNHQTKDLNESIETSQVTIDSILNNIDKRMK